MHQFIYVILLLGNTHLLLILLKQQNELKCLVSRQQRSEPDHTPSSLIENLGLPLSTLEDFYHFSDTLNEQKRVQVVSEVIFLYLGV